VTNTCFKRQKNKLTIYVSGSTVSTSEYLLLRKCDRQIIKNVKVIAGEKSISQHWLLVGDVVISCAPRKKKRMCILRLNVWKLREPNVKPEFAQVVYLPILTGKRFLLKLKGKVYANCVRSCLMHGSETWPMKLEHELKMNCTEMSMIRWMCGLS